MSGLEILGIAAAVLQIAELGGKLSVKLFTFSRKIKSADKTINSVSQDIAATGAVLQQLASVLKKDENLRLCSDQAIQTAKGLVDDCKKIFSELDDALDNRTTGNKYISAWKDRLKFPFIEPQIDLLQSNLERLKSSLVVMLNVLIYAEQLRNHEALPILKEQRTLIRLLVEDRNSSCKKFNQMQKTIGDSSNSTRELSDERSPMIRQRAQSPPVFTTSSTKVSSTGRELEIEHHGSLVENLMNEINASRYKINHGIRYRMHQGVLRAHWDEWSPFRNRFGHAELMKTICLHTEINQYWLSRLEAEEQLQEDTFGSSRPPPGFRFGEASNKNVFDLPPYESSQTPQKCMIETPSPNVAESLEEQYRLPLPAPRAPVTPDLSLPTTKPSTLLPPARSRPAGFPSHLNSPPALMYSLPNVPPPPSASPGFPPHLHYPPKLRLPVPNFPPPQSAPASLHMTPVHSRGVVIAPRLETARDGLESAFSVGSTHNGEHETDLISSQEPGRYDLASQWPLKRVASWLISKSFSEEWVITFENLNLEGSDVVDLGIGRNGRGNMAIMHQRIYPELAKVCTGRGVLWDQAREREEGQRLRKLLNRDMKSGSNYDGRGIRLTRQEGVASTETTDKRATIFSPEDDQLEDDQPFTQYISPSTEKLEPQGPLEADSDLILSPSSPDWSFHMSTVNSKRSSAHREVVKANYNPGMMEVWGTQSPLGMIGRRPIDEDRWNRWDQYMEGSDITFRTAQNITRPIFSTDNFDEDLPAGSISSTLSTTSQAGERMKSNTRPSLSEVPTPDSVIQHSPFCTPDISYNFHGTDLYGRLDAKVAGGFRSPSSAEKHGSSTSQAQPNDLDCVPETSSSQEVESSRSARDDENTVMRTFTKHARRCTLCRDPLEAYEKGPPLCDRGWAYAQDVAKYIYAEKETAYSVIDRQRGQRVQVRIPDGMEIINLLVQAFDRGLRFNKQKSVVSYANPRCHAHELVEIVPEPQPHRRPRAYSKIDPTSFVAGGPPRRPRHHSESKKSRVGAPSPSNPKNISAATRGPKDKDQSDLDLGSSSMNFMGDPSQESNDRLGLEKKRLRLEELRAERRRHEKERGSRNPGAVKDLSASLNSEPGVDDEEFECLLATVTPLRPKSPAAAGTGDGDDVNDLDGEPSNPKPGLDQEVISEADVDALLLEWTNLSPAEVKV